MKKRIFLAAALSLLLTAPAQAMMDKGEESGENYTMHYPLIYVEDAAAQQAINEDIAVYMDRFREHMQQGDDTEGLEPGHRLYYSQGAVDCTLRYEDAQVISLTMTIGWYSGGAHGMYTVYGLNYDKQTGARLPLGNYLRITPEQLNAALSEHLYDGSGKRVSYTAGPYKSASPIREVPQDYYLLEDGGIALQFQPYHLGSFAQGAMTMRFDRKSVAAYNAQNPA